jgi:hypothetical protein
MVRGARPLNCAGTYLAVGAGVFIQDPFGVALTRGATDSSTKNAARTGPFLWELTTTLDARVCCRLDEISPEISPD